MRAVPRHPSSRVDGEAPGQRTNRLVRTSSTASPSLQFAATGGTMTLPTSAASPASEAGSRPGVTGHQRFHSWAVRP